MDNNLIQCFTKHKYLDIILFDDKTFGKHINMITKVSLMRKLKFILDSKTLEKICLTLFAPYCSKGT